MTSLKKNKNLRYQIEKEAMIIYSDIRKYKVLIKWVKEEIDERTTKGLYEYENETKTGTKYFIETVKELETKLQKYEKSLKTQENKFNKYIKKLEQMKGGE